MTVAGSSSAVLLRHSARAGTRCCKSGPSTTSQRFPRYLTTCHAIPSSSRTFLGAFVKRLVGRSVDDRPTPEQPGSGKRPALAQDNLFHVLAESPIPQMRARAERIKRLAPCPVHLRRGERVLVDFDCPQCGWPTHASEKEWAEDEEHGKYIPRLREANEDEHDLLSGREMTEFRLPGDQPQDAAINMSSWDVFFFTRQFPSIDSERSRRHASKLLSFPTTIGSVLHKHSPYTTRNRRMTREGTRSFLALRQLLHPTLGAKPTIEVARIFVVGARAESTLPPPVWDQLRHLFPGVPLHLYLIGPEVSLPPTSLMPLPSPPTGPWRGKSASDRMAAKTSETEKAASADRPHPDSARAQSYERYKSRSSNYGTTAPSRTIVISETLTMTYIRANYEEVHHQLEPFDSFTDVFFAFAPGFGFPSQNQHKRPKEDGEEDEEAVGGSSSSSAQAAGQQTEASAVYDPIAADVESRGEASEALPGGLPSASSQVKIDPSAPTLTAADSAAAAPPSSKSASSSATSAKSPQSISHLPTLPPLCQAQSEWCTALTQILSTKCPLVITGFSPADIKRDVEAFESVPGIKGEFEWLITPGENVFGSLSWSIADFDPRVAVKANWGVWSVRGKRYDLEGPGAYLGLNLNPFARDPSEEDEAEMEEYEEEEAQEETRQIESSGGSGSGRGA